jgi:hypothetical protein
MVRASIFKACVHAPMTVLMEEAVTRSDAELARRIRLGARLVFYPLVLLMILGGWHFLHSSKSQPLGVKWSGTTSQGQAISAWIDQTGALTHVDTHIKESCSDGRRFTMHWRPAQLRFTQHGQEVQGYHAETDPTDKGTPDIGETTFAAKLGATPSGTITAGDVLRGDQGTVTCNSGSVTFTLHR